LHKRGFRPKGENVIHQNKRNWAFILFMLAVYPLDALSDYVFTAPPRENAAQGTKIYQPIADYLSQVTNQRFIYKHPQNWAEYSRNIQNNVYDLVFDGPHFVSWRIKNTQHDVLLKLPQLHVWRVIAKSDNVGMESLDDLVGEKVCAPKSPNFGMLTMMSHYSNPDKEPVHVITKSWNEAYNMVLQGDCVAAVIPKTNHKKFDPELLKTKSIHTHLPYPNQAITAGPRLGEDLKNKIANALLSEDGQKALSGLRNRYTRGSELVAAENEEYEGISLVLKRASNFKNTASVE